MPGVIRQTGLKGIHNMGELMNFRLTFLLPDTLIVFLIFKKDITKPEADRMLIVLPFSCSYQIPTWSSVCIIVIHFVLISHPVQS